MGQTRGWHLVDAIRQSVARFEVFVPEKLIIGGKIIFENWFISEDGR